MSLYDTHTHDHAEQESIVVGMPCADGARGRFPANILASEMMTLADLRSLAPATRPLLRTHPKGEVMASHTPKHWLPWNEQIAVQLGHAQAALRLLDDERALVKSCEVYADLILIDLHRAPAEGKAMWKHINAEAGRVTMTADLVGANDTVLLRWALERAA